MAWSPDARTASADIVLDEWLMKPAEELVAEGDYVGLFGCLPGDEPKIKEAVAEELRSNAKVEKQTI